MAVSNALAMGPSWHSLTDKRMTYNLIRLFSDQYRMRGSEFAELKAFAAVVERASFTQAANHLGLSPSALSQTIRMVTIRGGFPAHIESCANRRRIGGLGNYGSACPGRCVDGVNCPQTSRAWGR